MDDTPLPRLASRVRIDALIRRVAAAGGFATVLAHGDDEAGSIAVVTREAGEEQLLAPVMAMSGRYDFVAMAGGEAVPVWIEKARRRDPDLWIVELDIPQAGQFVAEMLGGG
jgi:hypothetical protein